MCRFLRARTSTSNRPSFARAMTKNALQGRSALFSAIRQYRGRPRVGREKVGLVRCEYGVSNADKPIHAAVISLSNLSSQSGGRTIPIWYSWFQSECGFGGITCCPVFASQISKRRLPKQKHKTPKVKPLTTRFVTRTGRVTSFRRYVGSPCVGGPRYRRCDCSARRKDQKTICLPSPSPSAWCRCA